MLVLIVEMGNHAIHAVPVIEGKVDEPTYRKYGKSNVAGAAINNFMLKLINEFNELEYGVIITKEDLMFEKDLYEVTNDLHKTFVQHGFQNSVKILSEESCNENSYFHNLPSELIKNIQDCLKYYQVIISKIK